LIHAQPPEGWRPEETTSFSLVILQVEVGIGLVCDLADIVIIITKNKNYLL
jgi:hypothetical protein